jgi:carbamoyltransferase
MFILGINAYHGDVSAVLLRDGELVAAVEEERFRRVGEGEKAGRLGGGEAGKRVSGVRSEE